MTALVVTALATLVAAAGLVALGHWMGSRSSSSLLVAMKSMGEMTNSTSSTLSQVTMQAAAAMNDPRMLNTLETVARGAENSSQEIRQSLERMEAALAATREATMMLHGSDRSRVEREILSNPSPKPVIGTGMPPPSLQGGWGSRSDSEDPDDPR